MTLEPTSLWIIAGLVLLAGEIISAGFFLVFIALGCFAAALVASLEFNYTAQTIACAVFSVAGVFLLRKPIQRRLLKTIRISADVGNEITVDQPIPAHKQVRITYQGTTWLATNLDSEPLSQGDRVVIVGMDGNILLLRKVN